jgi:hypothetical protein
VLDVLTIPMIGPSPQGYQTENHLIVSDYYWTKQSRATWQQLVATTDKSAQSLRPNGDSSFHGHNDEVSEVIAGGFSHSLLLIKPSDLALVVGPESQYGGGSRRRIRAAFTFNHTRYNFVATDPWIEMKYFSGADGNFPIEGSRLCISLSEMLSGSATKLVAAVITPGRAVGK